MDLLGQGVAITDTDDRCSVYRQTQNSFGSNWVGAAARLGGTDSSSCDIDTGMPN